MKIIIFLTALLFIQLVSIAENSDIDSVYINLKNINTDTSKVNFLNQKFLEYEFSKPEEAEKFANAALELSISIEFNKGKAESYTNLGFINDDKGNYDKAISYFNLAANIYKKLKDDVGIAGSYNYLGTTYKNKSEYLKAIDFIQKSLAIFLKINNTRGIATAYNNLGITYFAKEDNLNALEYYVKAVKIFEQTNNEYGIAATYCNIANIYAKLDKYTEAIDYYNKAIEINIKIGHKSWEAVNYHSLGSLFVALNNNDKAYKYFQKSLTIRKEIGDQYGAASSSACIGNINKSFDSLDVALKYLNYSSDIFSKIGAIKEYAETLSSITGILLHQKKTKESAPLISKLVEIAENIGINKILIDAYTCKYLLYEHNGELTESIKYLKLVIDYKDSLANESKQKILSEMGEKYDTEQKENKIKLLQKDKKLQDLELEKQRNYRNYLIIFGLLVSVIIVVLFISFQIKQKSNRKLRQLNCEIMQQKEEIEAQRDEITTQRDEIEKHRDIILEQKQEMHDSITYARRIQEAVLPISKEARSVLGEHFIMFLPKDIVSGDFYWIAKIENTLIITVADCTGHGVPGAFMSMLGISFLNEIVRKKEIIKANDVLNELRKEIINALQQKGEYGEQKDGMDMSLIAIKSQVPSSKFQIPSEEESEKVRDGESEQYSVIGKQLANNDTELRSSEMFIENESDTNPVATTNVHQSSKVPCDNKQTSNSKLQTSNFFNAQWAGANNPLWLVRNTKNLTGFENLSGLGEDASANNEPQTTNNKLFELKPDKMPIAIYLKMDSFTNHEIILQKGDLIYLMSDGYEDQFGGPKQKKFLSKNLKELLINNCQKPMNEQKQVLEKTLIDWIGNGQQIDDITIVGLKI